MQPGKFTEFFFLDEATALAAGHRPCALCRREDYRRFLDLVGATGADEIDERLTRERLDGQRRRLHPAVARRSSRRTFVLHDGRAVARARRRASPLDARRIHRAQSSPDGGRIERSRRRRSTEVLRAGWEPAVPLLHPSARPTGHPD